MASGPAAGLEQRYARIGAAAFALARRICGDAAVAADVVEQAFASAGDEGEGAVGDGLLLRRVRALASGARRPPGRAVPAAAAPPALAGLTAPHWRVLELVAVRGASVHAAAEELGLPAAIVMAHLHDALQVARFLLSAGGAREPDGHPQSPRLALLG